MGSKVSTLTVSLKDDVSGPAAKIGQALRQASEQARAMARSMQGSGASKTFTNNLTKLGLSAREIEKVSGALKDYARSSGMAANASSWTKEQTAQIRQWEQATIASLRHVKAEQRATANAQLQAAVEAGRARRAEQQASVRAARQSHLAEMREQERHARRHGAIGAAQIAAAGYVSAHSVGHGIGDTLKAGANYQHEVVALRNAGRTPDEMKEIEHASNDTIRQVSTATFSENLKVINETTGAFGTLHHAIENLPFMQKSAAVLHASAGDKIQDGAGELGNKLARFFEMRGTAGDTPTFQREAGEMVRAMMATRGNFNPHEMVNFAQQAKSSLPLYNERFMSKIVPSLVTEYGGERAGTGANAFRNVIMGKANDKKQAEEWANLGLLDKKMAIMKGGHAVSWKAGAIKDTNTALSDPLEWAEKTLIPALQKKGVNTDDKLELSKALGTMFRNSNSNMFAEALSQRLSRNRLHKDEDNYNKSSTVDEAYKRNLSSDPTESIKALKASVESLMEATSGPAMEAAAGGLKKLAGGIDALALAAKDHPVGAMAAGGAAGAGALAGAGYLSYKLLTGFGLPASATALTTAAGELSAAAALLSKGALPGGDLANKAGPAAAGATWLTTVGLWGTTFGTAAAAAFQIKATMDQMPKVAKEKGATGLDYATGGVKDDSPAENALSDDQKAQKGKGFSDWWRRVGPTMFGGGDLPEQPSPSGEKAPHDLGPKKGSLPPGTSGTPGPAPERLPGLDGRKSQIAGDLQKATTQAAALKAELAGVQAQLDGLKASGEDAFSPDTSGLESRKAQLESAVSEIEAKIRALNNEMIRPQADASALAPLGTAAETAKTELAALGSMSVSPQADASGLAPLGTAAETAKTELAALGAMSVSPTVNASSIAAARQEVAALKADLASIGGAADAARAKIAGIGSAAAGAKAQVASIGAGSAAGGAARARTASASFSDGPTSYRSA